jgi:hypothetical protein
MRSLSSAMWGTCGSCGMWGTCQAQGTGVGRALVEMTERIARDAGMERVLLTVFRHNPKVSLSSPPSMPSLARCLLAYSMDARSHASACQRKASTGTRLSCECQPLLPYALSSAIAQAFQHAQPRPPPLLLPRPPPLLSHVLAVSGVGWRWL